MHDEGRERIYEGDGVLGLGLLRSGGVFAERKFYLYGGKNCCHRNNHHGG